MNQAAPNPADPILTAALSYAAAGKPIFPCRARDEDSTDRRTGEVVALAAKSPYTRHGFKDATTRPAAVTAWWERGYPGALIGMPTGDISGVWVLDVDVKGDGFATLAALEAKHGELPATATVRSASGGQHYHFSYVSGIGNSARKLGPGLDVRGEGGFIILPGSVMADGSSYEWINETDPVDAPQWLIDLVLPKPQPTPANDNIRMAPVGGNSPYSDAAVMAELDRVARATEGGRNSQLNESAFAIGQFIGAGAISHADASARLMALAAPWGEGHKSRDTIERALRDGAREPRDIPAPRDRHEPEAAGAIQAIEPPASAPRSRFNLTWFDDIEADKPKSWIIRNVFGEGEHTVISGLPGTGKSVIAADAACHVAAGLDWFGRKVTGGMVLFVAAERKSLTERRLMAFRKHHGVKDVPLLVLGGRIDLTSSLLDARELAAVVKRAEAGCGRKCVWVIIDTLTRTFGPGDQNASKDMTRFVQSCDEIIRLTGAHLTVIHHTAWTGERGKGAIDLDGAIDASFLVVKNGETYTLKCDGTNDGDEGTVGSFTMKSITLATDEDGEPTTAPVVVPTDSPAEGLLAKGNAKIVLESLRAAVKKEGVEPSGASYPDGVMVVKVGEWRAAYYATDARTAGGTLRKRFTRAKEELLTDGIVKQVGEWFWPV